MKTCRARRPSFPFLETDMLFGTWHHLWELVVTASYLRLLRHETTTRHKLLRKCINKISTSLLRQAGTTKTFHRTLQTRNRNSHISAPTPLVRQSSRYSVQPPPGGNRSS